MPNWCNNVLELAHKDPAMLERAKDAFNRQELLQEFVPVPKELQIVAGSVGAKDDPKQIALEDQEKVNFAKYGYKNWYDWCVNEWGTKWDIGAEGYEVEIENGGLNLSFDSAWSPPIQAYEKLMELGFEVRAYYYEPGMAFAGVWDNGIDDFYEIGGYTSETIVEAIPSTLDEMFCISEGMREWEEENAEEDAE
jgi:hypothetical protein